MQSGRVSQSKPMPVISCDSTDTVNPVTVGGSSEKIKTASEVESSPVPEIAGDCQFNATVLPCGA